MSISENIHYLYLEQQTITAEQFRSLVRWSTRWAASGLLEPGGGLKMTPVVAASPWSSRQCSDAIGRKT